ncbi:hypothetical protein B0T22DRAFT_176978 [Podospora appendiculata]|uniref:FAD/NAD(P)-binding domain-containing protein n=1 Tax=Podospora appendiculata TaxID=314037 RepID=A0AAE0XBQ6_9PEZI|nr:hypothetical protein B0T22DRAFT_176978 [Podospora appendiculata]
MGSMFDSVDVDATAPIKILVIGGSYGGLSAALNLQDLCRGLAPRCGPAPEKDPEEGKLTPEEPKTQIAFEITIIDERDGFYHLIGSPLALADEPYAAKAWVKYADIPALANNKNITVLQGTVHSIAPRTKTATLVSRDPAGRASTQTRVLSYDYLVAATGLRRVWTVVPQALSRKRYLTEAGDHIRACAGAKHGVVVVGGGAVGIEMAAELKTVMPRVAVTLVHSRDKLLSAEPLDDETKDTALRLVREAGVDVRLSCRLDRTEEIVDDDGDKCLRLWFAGGESMVGDHVVMAVSRSVPSTSYLPREVLDEAGYVKIQASLAFPVSDVPNAADHFAVGDLVRWSGIKRCGGAMHMGYCAANNIHQLIRQRRDGTAPVWAELAEISPMIGLAVGKKAVAYWPQAGTTSGEDVMKAFFGDDLGFTICWNHLGLGGDKKAVTV